MSRWIRQMENERKKRESMLRTITSESAPIPANSYQAYRGQHGLVGGALIYLFRNNQSSPLAAYQDEHGLVKGTILRGREYWGKLRRKEQTVGTTDLLDLDLYSEDLDAYRARAREIIDGEVSERAVRVGDALTRRVPADWTEGHLLTAYAAIRMFDAISDRAYLDKALRSIDTAWENAGDNEREGIGVHRNYIHRRADDQSRLDELEQFRHDVKHLVDSEVSENAVVVAEELTRRLPNDWTEGHILTAYAAIRLYDATLDPDYLKKAQFSIESAWKRAGNDDEKAGISVHRDYIFGRRATAKERDEFMAE